MVTASIAMLVGGVDLVFSDVNSTSWQAWAFFGGFLGATVVGVIVQFACTAGDRNWHGKEL